VLRTRTFWSLGGATATTVPVHRSNWIPTSTTCSTGIEKWSVVLRASCAKSQPEGCTKTDPSGHITHVAGRKQDDANHQNNAGRPPRAEQILGFVGLFPRSN